MRLWRNFNQDLIEEISDVDNYLTGILLRINDEECRSSEVQGILSQYFYSSCDNLQSHMYQHLLRLKDVKGSSLELRK
jgi:hypothetical protein